MFLLDYMELISIGSLRHSSSPFLGEIICFFFEGENLIMDYDVLVMGIGVVA
jgi:hypothetical protein